MKFTLSRSPYGASALGALCAAIIASTAFGGPIPANLGSGLDVLVREHVALKEAAARGTDSAAAVDRVLAEAAQNYRDISISNEEEQVKVYIHLRPQPARSKKGGVQAPEAVLPASARLTAKDMTYRSGVLEAYVSIDDIPALANDKRVKSIALAIKPILDAGDGAGAAKSQGVIKHRINQVPQDGTGITVGLMSDSYDTNASASTRASADVTTGDLPGTTNPFGRTQPVVVLDDPLTGSDEGRGMMQIVHDEAPGSRLGFATASDGQVSFADNIRSLAGLPNGTKRQAGFACDVIVDDLYYSDSPMFGTSLVGRAVNEVAAAGVAYFSSAGNRPGQNGYFSDFRRVPAEDLTAAVAGTNLNFANVPADLYAGGFHDFDPTAAQDIAQTISQGETTSTSRISFQWDDPYDVDPPTFNPTPFFTATGTQSSTTVPVDFTLAGLTAGQQYRVTVIRTAGSNLDAVVEVRDPNGKLLLRQDTGFDEEVFFFAPISGDYKVSVYAFAADAAHTGAFEINAYLASGTPRVTSDFNLLFFRLDGTYYTSMSANNIASNQPIEIGALPFNATDGRRLQLVIARANIPTAPVVASRFRYVCTVVGGPIEYFDVLTPITFGHNHEPGCISAAAYSPFKPYVPEDFTSPGPSYIYFDEAGNRLAQPIIRQKPDVAAQDNVNTTFFGSDSASDADTQPNFSGTSAAAPSAAGIAALVLQANGGPGSVTAAQMKTILQRSGFKHDLDPLFASGTIRTATGGKLSITARGFTGTGNYSDGRNVTTADLRSFGVSYVGPGSVNGISLNVSNANPNGGTDVTPNPGLVWDNRARTTTAASGFPFTVGSTTGGITAGNITAAYTLPAPAPAVAGQFFQLELTFATGALTGGRGFTFGADRDEEQTANLTTPSTGFGNSADLLGANVSLDTNEVTPGGTTIAGTTSDGQPYSGTIVNRIGKGYSPLDGYGFINAQEAVAQPLP